MIRLRFVTGNSRISKLIRFQAGVCMPFAPSHVEAVAQDGKSYIGQHIDGGMMARPIDYDAAELLTLPDGTKSERIVELPCTPAQEAAFYAYVARRVGSPYDWKSIINFADPHLNLHDFGHLICSAEMTAALRAAPAPYFPSPLTMPFHRISPHILFLILSTHVQIDH